MGHRTALAATAAVMIMGGCSSVPVKRDYDAAADFGKLKAYAWEESNDAENASDNALMRDRIRAAVDAQLAAKGFRKSQGAPDFKVAYHYLVEKAEAESRVSTGLGFGFGSGRSFGGLGVGVGSGRTESEMETIAIDILEVPGGGMIWHGFARQELVRRSDPRKTTEHVNATVKAILAKFPPEPKRR